MAGGYFGLSAVDLQIRLGRMIAAQTFLRRFVSARGGSALNLRRGFYKLAHIVLKQVLTVLSCIP